MRAIRRFTVRTVLPEPLRALGELSLNLRWSWHPATRALFASIDPARWDAVQHDPVALLGDLAPEQLAALAADEAFVARVEAAAAELRSYLTEPRWYQGLGREPGAATPPAAIAYFSPEFGITSALPQYSGGLGILAGDHLKSASDLGVPIVGVGLLYQSGYFKQALTRDGWQTETYPVCDPYGLPLTLLREVSGRPWLVTVPLPGGRSLNAHVWKADVGRVPLLLLDSDVPENDDTARGITDRLYGGGGEHRLQQEMLLGIGGVRALRRWSAQTGAPAPEVFHTNEGHAGFLGLERIRELVGQGLSFDAALEVVRAATVFTTHTPVAAGIDRFGVDQIETYLGQSGVLPGVDLSRLLALGAEDYPGGEPGVFNMAVMGLRLARRANGVSRLHGEVSRRMFEGLWPGFDAAEVPITSITNGVHAPTWTDPLMAEVVAGPAGPAFPAGPAGPTPAAPTMPTPAGEPGGEVSDARLWAVRRTLRAQLVADARRRVRASWLKRGASGAELGWVDSVLDPDVLTIGFARRVPTYKRLTLMLRDPDRLRALLTHPERPAQLVVAGKSHPADDSGKRLIQQLVKFADDAAVRQRIVFLPNYDIGMAKRLYPGCDVWLNNPLRPLEACGTSGMKAALGGALNLSILDGWWNEYYDDRNGWAIPSADSAGDGAERDALEAAALYDLLEHQITPRFYERGAGGVPVKWVADMRHTLATLSPELSADRMVKQYVENLYTPAAVAERAIGASSFQPARDFAAWATKVQAGWPGVHVTHVESGGVDATPQLGEHLHVRAYVELGDLAPDDVKVELVYGRAREGDELTDIRRLRLELESHDPGSPATFHGTVELDRSGAFGYTVRVVPNHALLATPAELGLLATA